MTAKQKLHQAHLQEWASQFADQKASGLTSKQWCDQNHFSIHTYNYWKHLLKEEAVDLLLPDIVPVTVPAASDTVYRKSFFVHSSGRCAILKDANPNYASSASQDLTD